MAIKSRLLDEPYLKSNNAFDFSQAAEAAKRNARDCKPLRSGVYAVYGHSMDRIPSATGTWRNAMLAQKT